METLILSIEGMHCSGCATGIQMTTEQLDGVISAYVQLDGKSGTWEIDTSRISAEKIVQEIERLGYTALQLKK